MEGLKTGQMIMMQLGTFQFGIGTAAFQELTRSTEYRWASQDLFGQDAALQFTGPGADTISLPGVVYPEWRGGLDQIRHMRALALVGEPLQMVDGLGTMRGRWCIERVEEKQSIFAAGGVPRKQEFTISLRRFGPEKIIPPMSSTEHVNNPSAYVATSELTTSATSQAGGLSGGLTSALSGINSAVASAQQSLAPAIAAVKRGISAARSLQAAAAQAQRLVRSVKNISSLDDATRVLGGLQSATSGALTNAMRASDSLVSFGLKLHADGEAANVLQAVNTGLLTVNRLAVTVTEVRRKADSILKTFA